MKYDDVILRWAKIATALFTAMAVVADIFGVVIIKYIAYVWAGVFDLPRVVALILEPSAGIWYLSRSLRCYPT